MHNSFVMIDESFQGEIASCRNVVGIADNLQGSLPALDLQDLYRYSLGAAVSALDTFMHSLVCKAILLQLQGIGPQQGSSLPVEWSLYKRLFTGDTAAIGEIEIEIRKLHSRWTIQFSKDIAEAVKITSSNSLWINVAGNDSNRAKQLKSSLDEVVRRRNKIAHESDTDPSTGEKWPINSTLTTESINTVAERQRQILLHVSAEY